MTDRLASELSTARRHLTVEWDEGRSRRALARNHRLRRRRRYVKLAAGTIGAGAIAVALLVTLRRPEAPVPPPEPSIKIVAPAPRPPAPARERTLADGSRWVPEREGTALEVQTNTAARIALVMKQGRARIVVPPRPRREFVLIADEVELRVAGSHFSVELARGQVGVWVKEGQVQVSWPGGADLLHAGRSAWYPLPDEPLPAMTVTAKRPRRHPRRRHRRRRRTPHQAVAPEQQTDGAGDLLRAMDLARSRGNPVEAVWLLQAFLRDHAADPRAPLAAFTLGRVHLTQLGEPRQAARAFARARALAPSGSLAEDALAREVEAWARAGERGRARARAQAYLRSYPAGRRASSVRRHAGLE